MPISIEMADRPTVNVRRKAFKSVTVNIGRQTLMVPAVVLPGIHYDVLVGMSWLGRVGVMIDFS